MQNNFADISPQDMVIISEAERKLSEASGKQIALVAFSSEK